MHVLSVESEGLIVAHQVVVVVGSGEQVRVYQQSNLASVKRCEHLADGRYFHLLLMEDGPFLHEKNIVCDGSVGVSVCVVVEADHVSLGDEVEQDGGEEGEEADESTKSSLHNEALDP